MTRRTVSANIFAGVTGFVDPAILVEIEVTALLEN